MSAVRSQLSEIVEGLDGAFVDKQTSGNDLERIYIDEYPVPALGIDRLGNPGMAVVERSSELSKDQVADILASFGGQFPRRFEVDPYEKNRIGDPLSKLIDWSMEPDGRLRRIEVTF